MFRYTKLTAVREVVLWIVALVSLLPFYFLVATALKPDEDLLTTTSSALAGGAGAPGADDETICTGGNFAAVTGGLSSPSTRESARAFASSSAAPVATRSIARSNAGACRAKKRSAAPGTFAAHAHAR